MNEEISSIHTESLNMIRSHMRKLMHKNPKALKEHAKDMGMAYCTLKSFLNDGKDIIRPETFSRFMKWIEKQGEPLDETECRRLHDKMMDAVRRAKANGEFDRI